MIFVAICMSQWSYLLKISFRAPGDVFFRNIHSSTRETHDPQQNKATACYVVNKLAAKSISGGLWWFLLGFPWRILVKPPKQLGVFNFWVPLCKLVDPIFALTRMEAGSLSGGIVSAWWRPWPKAKYICETHMSCLPGCWKKIFHKFHPWAASIFPTVQGVRWPLRNRPFHRCCKLQSPLHLPLNHQAGPRTSRPTSATWLPPPKTQPVASCPDLVAWSIESRKGKKASEEMATPSRPKMASPTVATQILSPSSLIKQPWFSKKLCELFNLTKIPFKKLLFSSAVNGSGLNIN